MSISQNIVNNSSMNDPKCCTWISSLKNGLRLLLLLLCISFSGYIYLYNVTIPGSTDPRRWFKMFQLLQDRKPYQVIPSTQPPAPDIPILTLFTTWPPNETKYNKRNNITLINWQRLKPKVQPVYFSSNRSHTEEVKKYGWDVLEIRKSAAQGAPVLKTMFVDAMKKYESRLYGYSNGDILYDKGLLQTLTAVLNAKLPEKKPILVVGQRTNVNNVTMVEVEGKDDLSSVAKRGKVFTAWAEDYFITDKAFPWEDIPGVVIGRRGYDNWLVLHACKQKYTVIDATQTVNAVHQTTKAGNMEGHGRPNKDFNIGLLYSMYKKISFGAGITSCTPWVTRFQNNTVITERRKNIGKGCFKP